MPHHFSSRSRIVATGIMVSALLASTPAEAALWCVASTNAGQRTFVSEVVVSHHQPADAAMIFTTYIKDHFPFSITSDSDIEASCLESYSRDKAGKDRNDWLVSQAKRGLKPVIVHWFTGNY